MSSTRSGHPSRHRAHVRRGIVGRRAIAIAVVALAIGSVGPASVTAADPQSRGAGLPNDGLGLPSIQYEEARAHAGQSYDFTPGAAVTIPFVPRRGDRNLVDGKLPVPLPAGRASGRSMAASPQGSIWAEPDGEPAGRSTAEATLEAASAAPEPPVPQADPTLSAPNVLRREVLGFLPYWEVGDATLNYDVLSTIAYFGIGLDAAGNLQKQSGSTTTTEWRAWTSSAMTSVISSAHSHGTRVVLTIEEFAWASDEKAEQTALLSSATARSNAAKQIAAAVRDRGADGVNLDFEPIASGQAANFVTFVRTLRTELNAIKSGYQITIDTTGYVGNYDADALVASGAGDALFIMGYDFRTASVTKAGSVSPLSSPAVYDLSQAVAAFRNYVPASKIILGLPYYGRAWSTTSSALNAPVQTSSAYQASGTATYASAMDYAAQYGRKYDSIEQSAWTAYRVGSGSTTTWRELYFDDATSLGAKYDMINYWGLRGTGIWALGYEGTRTELASLLAAKFLTDRNPPLAGVVNLAPIQRNEGFTVSWTARDDWNGVKSYDVQVAVDGGAYANWLTGTTATQAVYQGADGHGYAFRARATDGAGNVGGWNVATTYTAAPAFAANGFVVVQADGLNERSAPTTSASSVGKASLGDVFQIIGGPVSANGYTWYQVTGPIEEWGTVTPPFPGPWLATGSGSAAFISPVTAPNSSFVAANIYGLTFKAQDASGATTATRTFSPNGDGKGDRLVLGWTNRVALDAMTLNAYRLDGSVAGTIALGNRGAGPQTYVWDGTLGTGGVLPNARYLLALRGTNGGATYYAPFGAPFTAAQWTSLQVTIDATTIVRYGGADRYASAAAVATGTFRSPVPVVYIASAFDFPDALAGAAAASKVPGPMLLVGPSLPLNAATVTALSALKPQKIVVLGGIGVVPAAISTELGKYTSGSVVRYGGTNRFASAAALAWGTFKAPVPAVYVANAYAYPDALAGAAAASKLPGPMLLVAPTLPLNPATVSALSGLKPQKIVILGGTGSVPADVASAVAKYTTGPVVRYGGTDRFDTSAVISKNTFAPGVDAVYLANAYGFADALAGAAAAGTVKGPVLLVDGSGSLDPSVAAEIVRLNPKRVVLLGGTGVVPGATGVAVHGLLAPQ